jgi:glutamate dehydrogenase (NAD(P)+)
VQGFGNVGGVAGKLFAETGARVVAVQDHGGTIYREAGLDVPAAQARGGQRQRGRLLRSEVIANDAFWDVECDILIPAALEQQITEANAGRIKAPHDHRRRERPDHAGRPTTSCTTATCWCCPT